MGKEKENIAGNIGIFNTAFSVITLLKKTHYKNKPYMYALIFKSFVDQIERFCVDISKVMDEGKPNSPFCGAWPMQEQQQGRRTNLL